MKKYDVIIVGAGPAGSSAAYVLAQGGYKVALLDKSHFPRDKLCGGGLSGRSKKVYEDIYACEWDEVIEYKSAGIAFYNKSEYLNGLDNYQSMHFVYRSDFDHSLTQKAEQAGADFMQGFHIDELDPETNTVTSKTGERLQSSCLIGADGIKGIVARNIISQKFDRNRYAIAMEAEIDKTQFSRNVEVPEIYYGSIKWGYGWIFPKKDKLTVGLAGLYSQNRNIKQAFKHFLEDDLHLSSDIDMQGYYLPFGQYCKNPGVGSKLLVGDAAGLVDPITGEGIAFAMQSGQYAAISIIEALKKGDPESAYKRYRKRVKTITRCIDYANYIKYMVYPEYSSNMLIRGLAASTEKNSIKSYLDLLADDISYPQFIRRLFSKSGKKIVSLLVR